MLVSTIMDEENKENLKINWSGDSSKLGNDLTCERLPMGQDKWQHESFSGEGKDRFRIILVGNTKSQY